MIASKSCLLVCPGCSAHTEANGCASSAPTVMNCGAAVVVGMVAQNEPVVGPVGGAWVAAGRRVLGKLSLWDRDQAWLAATERLVQQLEPGEVARAVCPALVQGFGRALLLATDRRLLGDGEHGWTCHASWCQLEHASEHHDKPDLRGDPTHDMDVAGIHVQLAGPVAWRNAFIAAARQGGMEDAYGPAAVDMEVAPAG
jgi:hypothetical protein